MSIANLKHVVIAALIISLSGCVAMRIIENNAAPKLGVENGMLKPLSSKPNCVSSQAKDESKKVAALNYAGDLSTQIEKVQTVLASMAGAKIVQSEKDYVYAVFTSKLMRFKDDVEVYLDEDKKLLHFRSASRVGYSDLGVNRKRYESFVKKLSELQ